MSGLGLRSSCQHPHGPHIPPGEAQPWEKGVPEQQLCPQLAAPRARGHQIPLRAADSTWSFLPYKALKGLIKDGFILKLLKGASDRPASAIPASL